MLLYVVITMLALPYKRYLYRFDGDFSVNGKPILLQTPDELRHTAEAQDGDTGVAVWDAAVFLAKYLETHTELSRSKVVLELGSGLGLCGLSALVCGASRVVLTDLEYILPSTRFNIDLNKAAGLVTTCAVDWFHPDSSQIAWTEVDTIIASDTIWLEHLVAPFVHTLELATTRNPNIDIILANQRRSDLVWNKFVLAASRMFEVTLVAEEANLQIFRLVRR